MVNHTSSHFVQKKFLFKIINIDIMKISYEASLMVSIPLCLIIQIHTLFILYQKWIKMKQIKSVVLDRTVCTCMILWCACQLLDTKMYISMIHHPPLSVDSYSIGRQVQHHSHRYLPPDFVLCQFIPVQPIHLQSVTPFYYNHPTACLLPILQSLQF